MDAAFALDRFDEDAAYIIVHNGFDGRKVAERHIRKPLRQRRQSFMIVVLTGRGQRFHGAAVKRILCRNDAKFCRVLTAAIFAGKLDDSFIGFGPTIGKKNPVHARYFSKLLRRLGLDFRIKQV